MGIEWAMYCFGAYLLGSIPFGKLIAAGVARIDIAQRGSGNIGATNVARELGIRWGILTLILDMLKGFVPVIFFSASELSAPPMTTFVVGLSALLGHQFSVFLGFKGGKGVATALGVYLALSPATRVSCLVALCVFVATVYKWDFVSLGSMTSSAVMPIMLALFGQPGVYIMGSVAVFGLICLQHRENIRRLMRGEESRWRQHKRHVSRSKSLSNSSSE